MFSTSNFMDRHGIYCNFSIRLNSTAAIYAEASSFALHPDGPFELEVFFFTSKVVGSVLMSYDAPKRP